MSSPVQAGDIVAGKYEIERIMATGGMGVVVAARHCHLDQRVAIKFMLMELLNAPVKPDAIERFVREGRAAVRLRGENVARVLDVDTMEDGTPFMVMEYLDGVDLSDHVAKHGVLPLSEAVDYVLQACVAMAEAHRSGIIHRDLKPENLFLTRRPDGTPLIKVLDFGISKLFTGDNDVGRTRTAVIMGSPAYMPPEQVRSSKDVDPRSDIWSLGVILYECTSGKRPFDIDGSTAALLAQVLYEAPRPLAENAPYLPQSFCQVVDHCLEKEPDQRYQSVGELASALAPFASDVGRGLLSSIHALVGGASGDRTKRAASPEPSPEPATTSAMARTDPATDPSEQEEHAIGATVPQVTVPGKRRHVPDAGPGQGELQLELPGDSEAPALAEPRDGTHPSSRQAREKLALRREMAAERERTQMARRAVVLRDTRTIVTLAVVLVLGVLTAHMLIRGHGVLVVDQVNDLIHRLGHAASGWAGETGHLLGGTVLQLAIPGALAALLLRSFQQTEASAICVWWLGANLMHIGRYMADAMYGRQAPIAGDVHVWGHLMRKWHLLQQTDTIAPALHWSGLALMIGALGFLLYGSLRS